MKTGILSARKYGFSLCVFLICLSFTEFSEAATDKDQPPPLSGINQYFANHFGSSPFNPPESNDTTFVVDQDSGLDTGCTFRSGGPLVFKIKINRFVGDVKTLKSAGLIKATARLEMPAFDVDYDANQSGVNPERDRVYFNGHILPNEYLKGTNNTWIQNVFEVPIDWINFANDPGVGGSAKEVENTIRIDIDVDNTGEFWCTSIDWAALTIEVARPVVMVHGILSSGGTWASKWVPKLNTLGLPNSNQLNMGNLDSIADNAAKIAREVANVKQRWGVDKVNLICHSKGGLDSRHYAENHNDIEQVIQIGTPNAGSPLANAIQAGAIVALGLGGSAIANYLAGPAGIQLTTFYMKNYNSTHAGNHSVRYTALAGDFDPDCFALNPFCRPIDRLLLAITGQGDTIVPITSVHALKFTENRSYMSSGNDGQAKHTQQTSSDKAFNNLNDRVSEKETQAMAQVIPPTAEKTKSIVGEITQGETRMHQLLVDETKPVYFTMFYPSGNLDITLTSPSGKVINPAVATSDPKIGYDKGDVLGGQLALYNFNTPEIGIWSVKISATMVTEPSGSVGYMLNTWLENPSIIFSSIIPNPSVHSGEALVLQGTLTENGVPLTDATVSAKIALPDNTIKNVVISDNGLSGDLVAGDGIYTGQLTNPTLSGNYRVLFLAERTGIAGKSDFSREDFGIATVSASKSSLVGTFSDFGLDTDNNGLFNQLVVKVDVDITDTAIYRVFGELTDNSGNLQSTSAEASLNPGSNTIMLSFDGRVIFGNSVNGPYHLSKVVLAEVDGLNILPVDSRTGTHDTMPYDYNAFEHNAIRLNGTGTSIGNDIDNNGQFDLLSIGVGVNVDKAGTYYWSAHLRDANGNDLGLASGSGSFAVGSNVMTFEFAGNLIGSNGVDGPYYVTDLLVYGAGDSLVISSAFTTTSFLASQFEGYAVSTPIQPIPTLSIWALFLFTGLIGLFGITKRMDR